MGKRVHVVSRHADYGKTEAFSWKSGEFKDLLESLGCEMCGIEYDYDNFECDIDEYEVALSLVKAYKKMGKCKEVEELFDNANADIDDFEDGLEGLGGLDNVLTSMQAFWNERDKDSGWISFSAW